MPFSSKAKYLKSLLDDYHNIVFFISSCVKLYNGDERNEHLSIPIRFSFFNIEDEKSIPFSEG